MKLLFALMLLAALCLNAPASAQEIALKNPGFEGETIGLQAAATATGQISGEVAQGWSDNSDWAPVSVEHARYRAWMKQFGTVKPIWNTEGGSFGIGSWLAPQTGGMAPRAQVAYIVRYDVTLMAAGARKSFLYAMHGDPAMGEIETRLTEVGNSIKPILAARRARLARRWAGNARSHPTASGR